MGTAGDDAVVTSPVEWAVCPRRAPSYRVAESGGTIAHTRRLARAGETLVAAVAPRDAASVRAFLVGQLPACWQRPTVLLDR